MSTVETDEFGLPLERRAHSDEYYTAWTAVLAERDKVGAEYAAMALWPRKPVDAQGDTRDRARRIRTERMEAAALKWLDLEDRADRMAHAEFSRSQHEKAEAQ